MSIATGASIANARNARQTAIAYSELSAQYDQLQADYQQLRRESLRNFQDFSDMFVAYTLERKKIANFIGQNRNKGIKFDYLKNPMTVNDKNYLNPASALIEATKYSKAIDMHSDAFYKCLNLPNVAVLAKKYKY